jgi:hypothetical protein
VLGIWNLGLHECGNLSRYQYSYQVIVSLIASTKTEKGLNVTCELDSRTYDTGIKITEEEMETINLEKNYFHGE